MVRLFKENLKGYGVAIVAVIVLLFVQAICDLYLPSLNADITNKGIIKGDIDYIWKTGGYMLLVVFASITCAIVGSFLASRASMGFGKALREKVFVKAMNYSQNEMDTIGTASLITRTTNDITQIQTALVMMLRIMISAPIMCIGGVVMAYGKSPELSWIIVFVIPVIGGIVGFTLAKGLPYFKSIQKKIDRLNQVLREKLTGIRVIRAFNKNDFEAKRFDEASKDLVDVTLKVGKLMSALMPLLMLAINFTVIGILWFGGQTLEAGNIEIGDLTAFISYAMQIMFSIMMASFMFILIPRASASADRIIEVLDLSSDIEDPKEPKKANEGTKGYIQFDNVTFHYPEAEEPVLNNISFSAKPGETTAIIGGTGSGKSTLVNLVTRFYDVSKGKILIDDVDLREFTQEDLRKKIGYIPQKAFLFSGTIADNIRFGKEDATEEEIMEALEIAQAKEFVDLMPEGIQSVMSQGGKNVSGGQKQRLSIARALVRKPEIYIFDDSFSALDFKTDSMLRAALKEKITDATMIIVAQRVSTIMNADRIIVLDKGYVVGMGTHTQLMKDCKVYKEIVLSQVSEEEIA